MGAPSVGIAGAGPAGLALAVMLRHAGWRVTVIDRFAAPASVGSGLMLQPTGLAVLAAMGLDPRKRGLGASVGRILGRRSDDGRVVLDVGYEAGGADNALGLHRSTLFGLLHAAALEAGAEQLSSFDVTSVGYEGDRPSLLNDDRRVGPFDLVVDALGAHSPLSSFFGGGHRRLLGYGALWATVPWPGEPFLSDALEQRYRQSHTMVGMLPVGTRWGETQPVATFFWSLRGDRYRDWREAGLDIWKREARAWPDVAEVVDHFHSHHDLTFARYSHHTLRRPIAHRLVTIGDAAHSTSPQLGQGANMALLDAYALAMALGEGGGDLDRALVLYARARRWHVRLYQALSLGLTPLYQSDRRWPPMIRDHLLRPLTGAPFAPQILAAAVSGRLLGPQTIKMLQPRPATLV